MNIQLCASIARIYILTQLHPMNPRLKINNNYHSLNFFFYYFCPKDNILIQEFLFNVRESKQKK